MSEHEQEPMDMGGTQPTPEHEWLKHLEGEWTVESEMLMGPDGPTMTATGHESVRLMGGLWAVGEGTGAMPDGSTMEYRNGLGYDVSFKGYRGFWIANMSSHLWKYEGELSADGRVMTLSCVGPNMEKDGETANYRDVIEILDADHRTMTGSGQDEQGNWVQFLKSHYTRV